MHPAKVDRAHLLRLTDLPNVGPACGCRSAAGPFRRPAQLHGRDAYDMYAQLCLRTGVTHDPCVIDVFLSLVRFMQGEPARNWWDFSAERKATLAAERTGTRATAPPPGRRVANTSTSTGASSDGKHRP